MCDCRGMLLTWLQRLEACSVTTSVTFFLASRNCRSPYSPVVFRLFARATVCFSDAVERDWMVSWASSSFPWESKKFWFFFAKKLLQRGNFHKWLIECFFPMAQHFAPFPHIFSSGDGKHDRHILFNESWALYTIAPIHIFREKISDRIRIKRLIIIGFIDAEFNSE